ncbi:hypothetical protein PHYBLDRAFT_68411 [Phycomyces blakesleeanus NRRL 1555(-)]|uniref:ATP-dependent DNA helicase n=1 Tax=Phycomyces blakesleeanus (strain ATCC 8743b / DSM 1359 / FGSC 10004 / NBRC 33097 / NRRL 1555) TaxID=763407 RepID=A0A167PJL7_PHYB8|nr:hypothetical protein PHYBLDRAFT_68411 [Phycomyces blakesleeanus NRRL 1555(-)]OAD78086.1 hypothetical protein PHYBLDRAFT_68411 [Phycomyces blakesleeanus NRRL 1555(-)]|eukprot:XP_018296126.1 hypothetical protein PHYBLDRAFT_68411 [Phycomyces blakesleeanus NRRL 1555(-)]
MSDPFALWLVYCSSMVEDYLHAFQQIENDFSLESTEVMYDRCLWSIESYMSANGFSLTSFSEFVLTSLPDSSDTQIPASGLKTLIDKQETLCTKALSLPDSDTLSFNEKQQAVYCVVMEAVEASSTTLRLYFVNGPGGTGKIFLFNAMLRKVREQDKIAIVVATSGITALLLDSDQTTHSRFKISLDINTDSMCSIPVSFDMAKLSRKIDLIVWNEIFMVSKNLINAVNCCIQDVIKFVDLLLESVPFSGKLLEMTQLNVFAALLLTAGHNINYLTRAIFCDLSNNVSNFSFLTGHAILNSKNAEVKINNIIMKLCSEQKTMFKSLINVSAKMIS